MFIAFALVFNFTSITYNIGTLDSPGPGLFPFIVSGLLLVVGIATVIKTRFVEKETVDFKIKNISIITLSLVGFALATQYINMIAGIVVLVAVSSLSANNASISRSIKIIVGLVAVACAFKYLLGLNLPLF